MLAVSNVLSPHRLATAVLAALLIVAALGVAIALADARRGSLPDLPTIRHIAGE